MRRNPWLAPLAAASLLGCPAAACAADYWFLGAGVGVYDFIDVSRISDQPDGSRQAWATRVLEGKAARGKVKLVLALYAFDCSANTLRLTRVLEYRANGQLKDQQDFGAGRTEPVTPQSVGAAEFDFVCAEPFSRADRYKDLGDIDPVTRADELHRTHKDDR